MSAAEAAGFDVPITVDRSVPAQQNFSNPKIGVIILIAATNRLRDLAPLIPGALAVLRTIQPGRAFLSRTNSGVPLARYSF